MNPSDLFARVTMLFTLVFHFQVLAGGAAEVLAAMFSFYGMSVELVVGVDWFLIVCYMDDCTLSRIEGHLPVCFPFYQYCKVLLNGVSILTRLYTPHHEEQCIVRK